MTNEHARFTPLYMYETLNRLRTMKPMPECIKRIVVLLQQASEQITEGISIGTMEPIEVEHADALLARYAERCHARNQADTFDVAFKWFAEQPEVANEKQALFCQAKFAEIALLASIIARIERLPSSPKESELN